MVVEQQEKPAMTLEKQDNHYITKRLFLDSHQNKHLKNSVNKTKEEQVYMRDLRTGLQLDRHNQKRILKQDKLQNTHHITNKRLQLQKHI